MTARSSLASVILADPDLGLVKDAAIGQRHGCSGQYVFYLRKKHGIAPSRPGSSNSGAKPWARNDYVHVCLTPGCTRAAGHDGALSGRLLHRDADGRYWRGGERPAPSGAVAGQESVSP